MLIVIDRSPGEPVLLRIGKIDGIENDGNIILAVLQADVPADGLDRRIANTDLLDKKDWRYLVGKGYVRDQGNKTVPSPDIEPVGNAVVIARLSVRGEGHRGQP